MTTTEGKRATYKQRYEEGDDGLRFQDLTYTGNFVGMEPVTDGIKGDKMLKARAKSKVLERVSKDDVLHDQFTIDEMNDLNNYLAWNIWDVLVMRATEGVSGMIPRQEYEILAFMHEFYRWPEILRMTTEEVGGAQGVMDIGATARREIGTKINSVHDWCIGAVGFGMGRCGLLALEAIGPDDYVAESNEILKFMQRVLWGQASGRLHPELAGPLPLPDPRAGPPRPAGRSDRDAGAGGARSTPRSPSSMPPPSCWPSSTTTTTGWASATRGPTSCRTATC